MGDLLVLLAHDLRNPLAALRTNLGFLSSVLQVQDQDIQEALHDSVLSCESAAHIIQNLDQLGFALLGNIGDQRVPVGVAAVVSEIANDCQGLAASYSVALEENASSVPPSLEVLANREMLIRALNNLIRNSIQHAMSRPVSIVIEEEKESVSILVLDGGERLTGAPEIFTNPEAQVVSKSERSGRYGMGLGLLSAGIAAHAAGAQLDGAEPRAPFTNGFRLRLERCSQVESTWRVP